MTVRKTQMADIATQFLSLSVVIGSVALLLYAVLEMPAYLEVRGVGGEDIVLYQLLAFALGFYTIAMIGVGAIDVAAHGTGESR